MVSIVTLSPAKVINELVFTVTLYPCRYRDSGEEASRAVSDDSAELLHVWFDRDARDRVGRALLAPLPQGHLHAHAAHPHLLLLSGREHQMAVQ